MDTGYAATARKIKFYFYPYNYYNHCFTGIINLHASVILSVTLHLNYSKRGKMNEIKMLYADKRDLWRI